jgi:hypothetical protein
LIRKVCALEDHIENAIAGVIIRLAKAGRIPLRPSRQTMHLMAKAAATVTIRLCLCVPVRHPPIKTSRSAIPLFGFGDLG